MNHGVFLLLAIIFAFAVCSAVLLEVLKGEHCKVDSGSFYYLYFPLFLVNNVFVTIGVFIFWMMFEQRQWNKREDRENEARNRTYTECTEADEYFSEEDDRRPVIPKQVATSYYDNVYPWDYSKPVQNL